MRSRARSHEFAWKPCRAEPVGGPLPGRGAMREVPCPGDGQGPGSGLNRSPEPVLRPDIDRAGLDQANPSGALGVRALRSLGVFQIVDEATWRGIPR